MTGFIGMNIEEVENLGQLLQHQGGHITELIGQLDGAIHSATWNGHDADLFKGTWWPEHKRQLQQVAQGLHDFGQSALNNANDQRNVSSH